MYIKAILCSKSKMYYIMFLLLIEALQRYSFLRIYFQFVEDTKYPSGRHKIQNNVSRGWIVPQKQSFTK